MILFLIFGVFAGVGVFVAGKLKEKGHSKVKQISVILVCCVVGGIITYFAKPTVSVFETPQDACESYRSEEIVTILEGKNSCMPICIVDGKPIYLLLQKMKNGYKLLDTSECNVYETYQNSDGMYIVLEISDTDDYYGVGVYQTDQKPTIKDNLDTEFIIMPSNTSDGSDVSVWGVWAVYSNWNAEEYEFNYYEVR